MSSGNALSPTISKKEVKKIHQLIEKQLQQEREQLERTNPAKLLLLGPADSGKTTVLKQMKILHGKGFNDNERKEFMKRIWENITDSLTALISAATLWKMPINEDTQQLIKLYQTYMQNHNIVSSMSPIPSTNVVNAIKTLWSTDVLRAAFARANEFPIQDTAEYFMNNIDKFGDITYTVTDQDILMTRVRTTKVSETIFNIEGAPYSVYDVGGQKSLRAFWVPYFDDVQAILFISSLAGYDQQMVEDTKTNRMVDAIHLFEIVANHKLLRKVAIILFLNKVDLLEKKIQKSSVQKYFPDLQLRRKYSYIEFTLAAGETDRDINVIKLFFKQKFLDRNGNEERDILVHFTTSTDTNLMKLFIKDVIDIVAKSLLEATGLL